MQVSIESISDLERKMTIAVPSQEVDSAVNLRLQEAAKSLRLNGFRKGKIPITVIKGRFGPGVRQEVVGELMSQSYYRALSQESIKPAGQPRIEATKIEEGQDLEFTATFEVYPSVKVPELALIKVEKLLAEVNDENIDTMITTLREQRQRWEKADRAAVMQDMVNIDFLGSMEGQEFAGGSGKGSSLVLGSNRMIKGFEEGLVGAKAGDIVTLYLQFPASYHSAELAGKKAQFDVTVHAVSGRVLPELNDEFYTSFGIDEGGEEAFRQEVRQNMEREMKAASRNKLKNKTISVVTELCDLTVPKALIDAEILNLRAQAVQQMGGGKKIDASLLPDQLFAEQAMRRVKIGLVLGEIIKQEKMQADVAKVRQAVEEVASTYESPDEVINWYYGNREQMANVEASVLEDQVFDFIFSKANVTEKLVSYETVIQAETLAASPGDDEAAADKVKE